jgi:hypothetical protein
MAQKVNDTTLTDQQKVYMFIDRLAEDVLGSEVAVLHLTDPETQKTEFALSALYNPNTLDPELIESLRSTQGQFRLDNYLGNYAELDKVQRFEYLMGVLAYMSNGMPIYPSVYFEQEDLKDYKKMVFMMADWMWDSPETEFEKAGKNE